MMPHAKLPAMPSASTICAPAAERRRHAGGRAHRAEDRGRMEAGLVHRLRHHQAEPAHGLDPDRDAEQRRGAVRRCRSQAASTAGTTTAPACTGPPSKVSSKSSPCAAVPLTKAAPAALIGPGMADRGAAAVVVPAGERGLDVVLVARGDAEADDVDQQILAFAAHGGGQLAPASSAAMRSASCSATEILGRSAFMGIQSGEASRFSALRNRRRRIPASCWRALTTAEGDDQHEEAEHRDGARGRRFR